MDVRFHFYSILSDMVSIKTKLGGGMKPAVVIAALLATGDALAQESPAAQAGIRTAEEGPPACGSGHDAALKDGVIAIRPGETICVDLLLKGKRVVPVAIVSEADADSTLVLRAWNESGSPDTFLSVHNPLDVFLRYEIHMLIPGATKAEYTSSCPVLARRFGLEHWPYAIDELTLADFKVIPESNAMECR